MARDASCSCPERLLTSQQHLPSSLPQTLAVWLPQQFKGQAASKLQAASWENRGGKYLKNVNGSARWLSTPTPTQLTASSTEYTIQGLTVGPRGMSKARAIQDLAGGDSAANPRPGLPTLNTFKQWPSGMLLVSQGPQTLASRVALTPPPTRSPRNAPPVTVTQAQATGREGLGQDCPGVFCDPAICLPRENEAARAQAPA